jgi:programmed cell death 6-interacting protein
VCNIITKHKTIYTHSPTKKASEIDLVFEKAAVLFNVGAVRSCMAASADRTTPEGMKLACQQFQLAAGIFKHLREKVGPLLKCALQSEMTPEGLQMVESIMLAQAQACFYEKAVADRARSQTMKASVIARLASQVGTCVGGWGSGRGWKAMP